MLDTNLSTFDAVLDEVVSDVDVFGALATRPFSVGFEKNRTFVVLIDDSPFRFVALCFQKVVSPQYLWHHVVDGDDFGFGGASRVQFLFDRGRHDVTFTEGTGASCLAFHGFVYRMMRSPDFLDNACFVSTQV